MDKLVDDNDKNLDADRRNVHDINWNNCIVGLLVGLLI